MALKDFNSFIQRLIKRFFLGADDVLDMLFPSPDFGEDVAHGVGEDVHEFVEEWFMEAEGAAVADSATQDAAQNIVAVSVARLNTVGDRKAQRSDMVGDDAESDVGLKVRIPRIGN